jgi:lipopolysaccharide export system protein LptA
MNRNRCSSGRRPEGCAATGTPSPRSLALRRSAARLLSGLPAVLLALLLAGLAPHGLAAQAGGDAPDAATVEEAAGPGSACPEERELCVQAERTGGIDLKTGVAHLEGNVRGVVRSRGLRFSGESLKAFRNGGEQWVRLVLERDVHLEQAGRTSESDHGVLERDEIRLSGHVRIEHEELRIEGQEAIIRTDGRRTVVHGLPGQPLLVLLRRALLVEEPDATPAGAPRAAPDPDEVTTTVRAQKAVVEDDPPRVTLTGDVRIEQSDERLRLTAQQVTLNFLEDRALESFRAEGDVVISQPDRRIAADFAQSRNALRTILLVGHATMQQKGTFDLKSDRMEVHADASKGILQSQDRQKPITLSLDLAGGQRYGLTQAGMLKLTDQGVPTGVLEKLAPLIGQTYASRTGFREAVSRHLTRREVAAYLDTIVANAR